MVLHLAVAGQGIKCFHGGKGFWKIICSYSMFVQNRTLAFLLVEVGAGPCCLFRHSDAAGSIDHLLTSLCYFQR